MTSKRVAVSISLLLRGAVDEPNHRLDDKSNAEHENIFDEIKDVLFHLSGLYLAICHGIRNIHQNRNPRQMI